jgi:hypothetical protein
MMDLEYEKRWDDIIRTVAFDVYALELIDDNIECSEIQMEMFSMLVHIFSEFKRMSRGRFFKKRELDAFWLLLIKDIVYLHEISEEWGVLQFVYITIDDMFDCLLMLNESQSDYECADNLLKFKKEWFATFKIKINSKCEE